MTEYGTLLQHSSVVSSIALRISDQGIIFRLTVSDVPGRDWPSRLHECAPKKSFCVSIIGEHLQRNEDTACTGTPSV